MPGVLRLGKFIGSVALVRVDPSVGSVLLYRPCVSSPRATLNNCVANRLRGAAERRAVRSYLDAWFAEVSRATWRNSAELKARYATASIVSAERVVFNIKGNDYRLIVAINDRTQFLLIKWLGTHAEYDHIDAKTVEFEKERYDDPTHSH